MRALLLAIGFSLLLAPAASAQEVIDRAAESLRTDPVYVDPEARDILSAADEAAVEDRIGGAPIYVAVLPDGSAPGQARAIAEELRRSGTYAVVADRSFAAGPSARAAAAADAAVENGGDAESVLIGFVDELEGGGGGGGQGDGVGAGGLILLGLAGAGGAAVLLSRRRRRRAEQAEFAEVKENVRDDLVALGDDIRALDLDVEMPGVDPAARADYEVAVNAYDRADQTWRLARRPEDMEPVGSALEEGRWAMTSAKARLEGRRPPERLAPCFFDPRHGPSSREVEWAPVHGEPRMVPACEADAQRVEREEDPEMREVTVGGQRVPYWQAGPAYAPFAGGFFGFGLLPGLMMGTMLGSAFDADVGSADVGGGDWGGGGFGGGDFGGGDFGGGDF